jgi:uncharacterized membrane protein
LSLFGMFIGSLTYYFISGKYEKKITKMHRDASVTLKFLDEEERVIVKSILDHEGKITQSEMARETKLSRVKIFRSLKKLEWKGVIIKKPHGMTNIVELGEGLKKVLLE